MSSRKPAKEKRSPSSDASAPPPKSASSSRRSTATPVGDDARPNVSSKPSSSATLEARRPTSRLARSSTSNSNAETDDTPKPVSAGNRKTRRSSSVSSLEGSLIGDPVDDRPSRHASSSLSDQSSKSPSPPPATVRQTSSQPNSAKRSPPKRVELTPVDSSSEDDTDASQSFTESFTNQGRGRARPRGAQRPPTKSNPRRAPTSATSSRGRLSPPPEFYAPARATRATVALPPGYIEGVKSTRMPRRADSAKAESSGVDDDVRPKKGVPKGKAKEQELEEERQKERERARERELELEREEQEREAELELEQQAARELELERKREREREQEEEEEREREQEPERLTCASSPSVVSSILMRCSQATQARRGKRCRADSVAPTPARPARRRDRAHPQRDASSPSAHLRPAGCREGDAALASSRCTGPAGGADRPQLGGRDGGRLAPVGCACSVPRLDQC